MTTAETLLEFRNKVYRYARASVRANLGYKDGAPEKAYYTGKVLAYQLVVAELDELMERLDAR